jgi:hypothetical protein
MRVRKYLCSSENIEMISSGSKFCSATSAPQSARMADNKSRANEENKDVLESVLVSVERIRIIGGAIATTTSYYSKQSFRLAKRCEIFTQIPMDGSLRIGQLSRLKLALDRVLHFLDQFVMNTQDHSELLDLHIQFLHRLREDLKTFENCHQEIFELSKAFHLVLTPTSLSVRYLEDSDDIEADLNHISQINSNIQKNYHDPNKELNPKTMSLLQLATQDFLQLVC